MRLFLDTHVLLCWISDDPRIGSHRQSLLRNSNNHVLVSIVSLWEVAIKAQAGKLAADVREILDGLEQDGFDCLGISVAHLVALTNLPRRHKDPFDHLLIAQATAENATLMSEDRWMPSYPVPIVSCSA